MAITVSSVNIEDRKKLGLNAGDTVRVWQKIQEKGKTRLQAFEGLVLAKKHGGEPGSTFTVRRVTQGVGVEKVFPLFSPTIDKIEIIKRSSVRRAKLYFIREKAAKEIKRQMRNMRMINTATVSDIEEKESAEKDEQEKIETTETDALAETLEMTEVEGAEAPAEKPATETKEPKTEDGVDDDSSKKE